jgi:hypothetical protein
VGAGAQYVLLLTSWYLAGEIYFDLTTLHNKLIMFLVETAGMMADMFTKVADKVVFAKCRAFVMNLQ